MQSLLKLLLCLSATGSVTGFRARGKKTNSTVVLRGADCQQLADIDVLGRNVGQAAVLLCQFWPTGKLGNFPVNNAKRIADLVNQGGDLWNRVRELAKGRPGEATFCWKKAQMRKMIAQMLLDSHLNFTSQDMGAFSSCDMELFGRCYGSCPAGMKPMAIVGSIIPACTSDCRTGELRTGCGFGCAKGLVSCGRTLVDQVGTVTKAVASVASFMSGNPLISEVVDKVLRLVDFFIDVMFKVVGVAKKVYSEWPRGEAELGIIIALLQFVLENAKELGQDFLYLKDQFGETLEMVMELIDAEFEWREINLGFITNTILSHGSAILDAAFEFATVFVFPTC